MYDVLTQFNFVSDSNSLTAAIEHTSEVYREIGVLHAQQVCLQTSMYMYLKYCTCMYTVNVHFYMLSVVDMTSE